MTSIRKSILVSGNPHYVEVNSSLDLEEVEITGLDPVSGKTVHVSLSSLLRQPRYPEPSPYNPQPLQGGSPGPYGSPSSSPGSLMDLNVPSPSSLSFTSPPSDSSPAPMDMFSEPLPAIVPAQTAALSPYASQPTITPPLSGGIGQSPAAGGLGMPSETTQSSDSLSLDLNPLQGLEAIADQHAENEIADFMKAATGENAPAAPKRADDKEDVDNTLDSMYRK